MRTNGFQRPFHVLQVTSWIVFSVDAAVFSAVGFPLLRGGEAVQAVVGIVYFISIISLIVAAVFATKCNPQDPHLKRRGSKEDPFTREELDELPYCEDCDCPVFPRSKHCRACDKCVHVFDHHCKWLNNCIGQYNYHWFAQAVISVAVMTGIVLLGSLSILIEFFVDDALLETRLILAGGGYSDTPKEAVVAILAVLVVVNMPLCLLDLQLVFFHAFLTSQHLTTFEYIMNKRELEEEREAQAQAEGVSKRRIQALPKCMDWIVYKAKKRTPKEAPSVCADSLDCEQEPSCIPVSDGQCLEDKIAAGVATTDVAEGTAVTQNVEVGATTAASGSASPPLPPAGEAKQDAAGEPPRPPQAIDVIMSPSEGPTLEITRPTESPNLPPSRDDLPTPPAPGGPASPPAPPALIGV
eukprot:TRINITY_DN39727_c0_g1_i1.p1 TRINITY_DN39727_c0_g1~~TRINITY_DN39727_c0_g1_i1.p1  ORF type:complete len:411 (-),score=75.33 TRINITY_DN39727_c0_g1_i1:137-1369(-)